MLKKIEKQRQQLEEQKQQIADAMKWKLFGHYQISTTVTDVYIPEANEVYLFVGGENREQVYGGRSYILPNNQPWNQIIREYEIRSYAGDVIANKFYVFYENNQLRMNTESGQVLVRIYYR